MAFHFPLMPRLFMGLRLEDRHPLVDILQQTPPIPEGCQWALFLRNHDELTLEMVTDEERDYMYSVYAGDPQMRLNLGIRRRLAPLMENSRRRVELLNSLLFALPGTPIIYYGDEIGMGDNIYLGDRNGVRTPMQWNGDRNGGFARADPARLYAPPIMDPVYGYQAINVEAQERFPWSLLSWMKRLIALRRQHRVFGRGALEIIYGPNRKVLSFLRRDAHETILVVANLSRTVQPAELDLRGFAGLIPVEMWGLTEFPRIGEQPYFLTLGAYASYWFSLQHAPMQIGEKVSATAGPAPATADSLPALLVGVDWQTVLDGGTRLVLERQALRPFLRRQRWFAAKTRDIRHARFSDWARIRDGAHPAFLAVISVEYTDGWNESYLVPLSLLSGAAAEQALKQTPDAVLATIAGARRGAIVDGITHDETCDRMLEIVRRRQEIATELGTVVGTVTASRERSASDRDEKPQSDEKRKWTRSGADHSNTVAFLNEEYALKLYRKIEPGPNPELELTRVLTESGFSRIPSLVGALEYSRPGADLGTLAVVQTLITHQGSGWQHAIDELGRYYERVAARAPDREESEQPYPSELFVAVQRWYLNSAALLGRRTAELHLTLADSHEPAFVPERLDPSRLDELADSMRAHADAAFDLLVSRLHTLDASRPLAESVLAARQTLVAALDEIRRLDHAGHRIRIHGDYHLGQVLRTEEDFVILDLEGEPARPFAERRAKQSPLKDVAGMLRSYGYAAYAALFAFATHAPDNFDSLEPWAAAWQRWVGDAFVREYRKTLATEIIPSDDASFNVLLRSLTVDKALYELAYELNNRPEWVRIPLTGLLKMIP
jgi:maltose alpha-D-glucosyltransferase/alpha-amylase